MLRTALCLLSLVTLPVHGSDHVLTPPGRPSEHTFVAAMFDAADATHTAIADGEWTDAKTWAGGVPKSGGRVHIPETFAVSLGSELAEKLDWIRVDGRLQFAADRSARLSVATLLVSSTGVLQIGTTEQRIQANRTATIVFLPRTKDYRDNDPYDFSGGLLAMGQVRIIGSERSPFAMPMDFAAAGQKAIAFAEAPKGWRIGDELLFPAATEGSQDERRAIVNVSSDGKTFELAAPLEFAHAAPAGISCRVPVGNLTRNVVLSSAEPETIASRGHIMLMAHEGVDIRGAAFRGLGRTQTERIHTLPERDAEGRVSTGDNVIGRYAVHFHLRHGARFDHPPLQFIGNAIVDSPKHGLVNHGGHVVAEGNVTYDIHGSHFFAENGSEIGAFRNNLAVYSRGSGDQIRSRECLFDFGHGGHGFWTQSAGVRMENNYAFHHAQAAYSIFPRPVKESGTVVRFARRNAPDEVRRSIEREFCPPDAIPFRFTRNAAGNCGTGLEIWNANVSARHNDPSVVSDCQFWNNKNAGIEMPYTFNTAIRDTVVQGPVEGRYPTAGIHTNSSTRFLTMERVAVSGYRIGIEIPVRGHTLVADCRFDNDRNIQITSPVQPNRRTILKNNTFVRRHATEFDYYLAQPDCKFNGDLSLLFDRDVLLVHDARFPGQTVYFLEQHAETLLNNITAEPVLINRTTRNLWEKTGLAIAGGLAPEGSTRVSRVRGLVGLVSQELQRGLDETAMTTFQDDQAQYTQTGGEYSVDQNRDRVRFVKGKPGEKSGWRFETTFVEGQPRTKMTYVDSASPRFELASCVKLHIHPDDVQHGIELCGLLHDDVAGKPTIKNMIKEFKDLKVDPDGYVTVKYACADAVGNVADHTFRFEVTEEAPRRGKNIAYYNQKEYMPPEEPVVQTAQSRRSWKWAWISGLALSLFLAGIGTRIVYIRRRAA